MHCPIDCTVDSSNPSEVVIIDMHCPSEENYRVIMELNHALVIE
jgi:hypothetical protein